MFIFSSETNNFIPEQVAPLVLFTKGIAVLKFFVEIPDLADNIIYLYHPAF